MKRTFFYSEKQKHALDGIPIDAWVKNTPKFIDGKEFTEQQGGEGEHRSNWDDAVIVHVQEGLKKDEVASAILGRPVAESYYSSGFNYEL
jgi:hypothetical protein